MATFTKLPSGSWRVQVKRKGNAVSETFLRRGDAELWGRSVESKIDRDEPTWLDHRLVEAEPIPLSMGGFGREVRDALQARPTPSRKPA